MKANLRVLMTADTVGGVWRYATELIRALAPYGVDFTLATMGGPVSEAQRAEIQDLPNVELAAGAYKLEWMNDPWSDVDAASEWLLELEETFRPDVIHLNGYVHGALPWRAPRIVAGHSCVLSWWRGVKGEHAPADWRNYAERVRCGLRAVERVIAPSRAMLEVLEEQYGPFRSAEVIPNGLRVDEFKTRKKEPFVLSAGRLWDEAKNVRAVCACSLPWPVCVAGETQHPNGSAQAADLQKVRCLGRLEHGEIKEWFSRASIYALPACYEPFGLSILEAALSQCALVLGDIPSLRENWEGAALFVDPRNANALEETLGLLIADEDARVDLGRRARLRGERFAVSKTAQRYLETYQTVRSRNAPQREEECLAV